MEVLVIGYWNQNKSIFYKNEAEKIGEIIAKNNHSLITGGGVGMSKLVVDSYRLNNGKKYTAYFPSFEEMIKIGDKLGPVPDLIIETKGDYVTRNTQMIKKSDLIIALPGGIGTLGEIINAIKDYKKNVLLINKGELASWIKVIPPLINKVTLINNLETLFL
jgi:predicted Rossmann-fold nucleotide-binding protein